MPFDKKQTAAFHNFLKATAALLLAFTPEEKKDEKPDDKGGDKGGDKGKPENLSDMLDADDEKAKKTEKEKADKELVEKKAEKKKKEEAEKEKKKEEAEKEKGEAPAEIKKTDPDQLLADARAAAIAYAGKHGRDALRTLLNEFTNGNIAEVEKAKLPDLITKLRA